MSPVQEDNEWWLECGSSSARLALRRPVAGGKRTSGLYTEDAKVILDSIHASTEKMIEEITAKYGDLDGVPLPEPPATKEGSKTSANKLVNKRVEELKYTAQKDKNEHGFLSEDESNFSSDSLEDCSLNAESEKGEHQRRRRVCRKHPQQQQGSGKGGSPKSTGQKSMYDRSRNVSLSEILMDDKEIIKERHKREESNITGSGGIGVPPFEPKSEESFLSDDFSNENLSYYNSMESIMSDESAECKSAPLDVFFNKPQHCRGSGGRNLEVNQEVALSKSYGSSPNNCPGFDYYYMQSAYSMANRTMTTSNTFPKMSGDDEQADEDEIPSSQARMDQYKAAMNKSLREDFGVQRAKQSESLWMRGGVGDEEPVRQFKREDIFGATGAPFGLDLVNDCESRTEQSFRKFEQNLQKFERDRSMFGHAGMQMDYVPHKPPMAGRRSTSMRSKKRKNLSGKFSTMGNIVDQLQEEEMEDAGMINLQLNFNEPLNNSTGCLDSTEGRKPCNWDVPEQKTEESEMPMNESGDNDEFANFNDIRNKIEIVQKLVAMEERKLEEARMRKECRMRPFQANVKEKGYVKSLTMNFDNLAKGGEGELAVLLLDKEGEGEAVESVPREFRVKRIKSVPELESVKFKSFQVLPDEMNSALPNRFYNDLSNSNKNNTNQQLQQEMSQGSRIHKAWTN